MLRSIYYGFQAKRIKEGEWPDYLIGGMEGWRSIVNDLINDLFSMGWDGSLLQIKEKFGGLRFYIDVGTDEMYDRIARAESESVKTCMICGEPGEVSGDYWLTALCPEHTKERDSRHELLDSDSGTDSAAV